MAGNRHKPTTRSNKTSKNTLPTAGLLFDYDQLFCCVVKSEGKSFLPSIQRVSFIRDLNWHQPQCNRRLYAVELSTVANKSVLQLTTEPKRRDRERENYDCHAAWSTPLATKNQPQQLSSNSNGMVKGWGIKFLDYCSQVFDSASLKDRNETDSFQSVCCYWQKFYDLWQLPTTAIPINPIRSLFCLRFTVKTT